MLAHVSVVSPMVPIGNDPFDDPSLFLSASRSALTLELWLSILRFNGVGRTKRRRSAMTTTSATKSGISSTIRVGIAAARREADNCPGSFGLSRVNDVTLSTSELNMSPKKDPTAPKPKDENSPPGPTE